MRFAIIAPDIPTKRWKENFERIAPKIPLLIGENTDTPEDVVCAMVWKQPIGSLVKFKNLKLIFSMGAGVDHVLLDTSIPNHIPVCRVVDPKMAFSMTNYILMGVLNHHRAFYDFQQAQKEKHWAQFVFNEKELRIGVLGTGQLGMDAASKLNELGFSVFGYSNSPKETLFPSFSEGELDVFLGQINVLICTVPYTPNTHGLLNYKLFQKLKYPTYLINVSRGAVQVEKDILEALDKGLLSGAFLDVFEQEPLVKESPLWDHPKIKITPHIASLTYPEEGIHQVLESFERVEKGLPLKHQIDRKKMY
ncbi:MAG: glyoxylate/hydroxypyruvate reductase A [Flavobacteriaceae bacterium]|nr:glyoxylate/hydroxypyruvate reductase A [Flavobacteriaceae bacterium]